MLSRPVSEVKLWQIGYSKESVVALPKHTHLIGQCEYGGARQPQELLTEDQQIGFQSVLLKQQFTSLQNFFCIYSKMINFRQLRQNENQMINEQVKTSVIPFLQFIQLHNKINNMNKISIATHEEVQKHPANTSLSKVSFRFSKSKRFRDNNPQCPIAFYSYRSQLSRRRASIGNSRRTDFTLDLAHAPSSALYDFNTYYQFIKNKGLSFRLSREVSPDQSYLIPQIHRHPGVGEYEYQKPTKTASSYSIRAKTIDTIERHLTYKQGPGPGAYEAVDLDPKKSKIKISKFKNPKLGVALTSPRFRAVKDAPGPQNYKQLDNFSPTARYVVSQHQGRGTRPFTREKRFTHDYWRPSKNPGPSDYQKPSDFGLYGGSKYYKELATIQ